MTKEQRAYVAKHIRNLIAHDEAEHEDSDLPAFRAALAIFTDEAEADRKLGATVRSVVERLCIQPCAEDLKDYGARLTLEGWGDAAEIMETIARALLEEAK